MRESDRANSVDGDYKEAVIDRGQWREFGLDTRVTPLLFTTVVTNLFKLKIPDLSLYGRQDLPIEELIEKDSPDCTSNLRPFI